MPLTGIKVPKNMSDINRDFLNILTHSLCACGTCNNTLPVERDRGHVYIATLYPNGMKQKAIHSIRTLSNKAREQYVTAAAFYHQGWGRTVRNLRWINALVLDFDVAQNSNELEANELAVRIADSGLPAASMFVRSPSGGIHTWWFLHPVRATRKAVRLYTILQKSLADELGADICAVGAERFWRMPTVDNVIYSSNKKFKLSQFRSWRDKYRAEDMPQVQKIQRGQVYVPFLIKHPGVKQLLRGVTRGQRNEACFALAVAHLISGYSIKKTEQLLLAWNGLNTPSLSEREVYACINSAARGIAKNYRHYFNAFRCRVKRITGLEIKYQPISPAKPRNERKRTHMKEHEQDILNLMRKRGGRLLITQAQLAELLNAPLRSIKLALSKLEESGFIFKHAIQRGRKSFTVIVSRIDQECKKQMVHSRTHLYGIQRQMGNWGVGRKVSFVEGTYLLL